MNDGDILRAVITAAREQFDSPAAFDRAFGLDVDAAEAAMDTALYLTATGGAGDPVEGQARYERLRDRLAAPLASFRQRCRRRRYVGWSRWGTGPVRYAEQPGAGVAEIEQVSGYPVDQD